MMKAELAQSFKDMMLLKDGQSSYQETGRVCRFSDRSLRECSLEDMGTHFIDSDGHSSIREVMLIDGLPYYERR